MILSVQQHGIIYVDEIDKITRKGQRMYPITRDVSGEGVQQALLKDPGRNESPACRLRGGARHPHQEFIQIDTTNILFICGGAFDGLEKVIESRDRPQGHRLWC